MAASTTHAPAASTAAPQAQDTRVAPVSTVACGWALRAASGDRQAYETLVESFRVRLLNLLRSMVQTPADADEVLQQAFLQVHLALPKMRPPQNDRALSAWIFRIAVNAGLMHLRARRRRPILHLEDLTCNRSRGDGLLRDDGPQSRPDDRLLHKEMSERLHLAIAALPDKYRLVLWLRDIEEQSNDEVANTLGLTVPTVKARLLRARHVVRGSLTQLMD